MFAYGLTLTAAVVLLASILVWKMTARLSHPLGRWTLRAVGIALFVTVLPRFLVPELASHLDHGTYVCTHCGRRIERLEWLGVPMWTEPWKDEFGVAPTSNSYATAFASEIGASHAHQWLMVGCHAWGMAVQCSELGDRCAWFADLPRVGDQDVARAVVHRLCAASPEVQHRLLCSYEHTSREFADPDARFRVWLAEWNTRYPDGR